MKHLSTQWNHIVDELLNFRTTWCDLDRLFLCFPWILERSFYWTPFSFVTAARCVFLTSTPKRAWGAGDGKMVPKFQQGFQPSNSNGLQPRSEPNSKRYCISFVLPSPLGRRVHGYGHATAQNPLCFGFDSRSNCASFSQVQEMANHFAGAQVVDFLRIAALSPHRTTSHRPKLNHCCLTRTHRMCRVLLLGLEAQGR